MKQHVHQLILFMTQEIKETMAQKEKLHIAMFPWLAFGHLNANLELAKAIAERGHYVSFISTPRNIERLPEISPSLSTLINYVKVPLPHVENLPENAESTMDIPNHLIKFLMKAMDGMQQDVVHFLETSCPDWIIYDFTPYWLPSIAAKLGISGAFFCTFNASSFSFFGSSLPELRQGDYLREKSESFTVPPKYVPFPTCVVLKHYEAKKLLSLMNFDSGLSMSAVSGSQVIFIRTCMELESEWLSVVGDIHQKPFVTVGLLPPAIRDSGEHKEDISWKSIKSWLDKQEKGSVVYVALGSEVNPSQEEFTELAMGLELSGLPFIWALRKKNNSLELPDGFEDRTRDRGIVWTTWAPQLRILKHQSVGGFFTHCGWSSTIEGLCLGCPLIMFPLWGDQWLNARFMEEQKVGIEVPRNADDGWFTRNSVAESLRLVIVEEEGKIYRDKAGEMGELLGNNELHGHHVDKFIDYLKIFRK